MGISTPSGGGGAPTDAAYVTGSSNSELSNETVVSPAGDILTSGSFGTTKTVTSTLDTWFTVDSDNPALVSVETSTVAGSNTNGVIRAFIDTSGGTTADYDLTIGFASTGLGSGGDTMGTTTITVPAGAQVRWNNSFDPNNSNSVRDARAQVIIP
jgi:hypothetical protein